MSWKNTFALQAALFAGMLCTLPAAWGDEPIEERVHQARLRQYASDIALAQVCWQIGRLDRATMLLERQRPAAGEEDLRGIEWYCLWRTAHAEQKVWSGHSNPVRALNFLPDDSAVIASDSSYAYAVPGEIRQWPTTGDEPGHVVWRQEQGKLLGYFSGFRSLAVSPDGRQVAVPDGQKVQVLDLASGEVLRTLEQHEDFASAVAFSRDGKQLASGGLDKTIKLWDPQTGKLQATLQGHELGVMALAFSPDGKVLAAGGGDERAPDSVRRRSGELKLWNLETQAARSIDVLSFVVSVDYAANGQDVAVGTFDGTVTIVGARDGVVKRTITPSHDPVTCVRFAPDSKRLATSSTDGTVRLWEVDSGAESSVLRGHRGRVEGIAFSHDGRLLASGGGDQTVRLWNAHMHPERTRVSIPAWSIHSVAFSADNRTLAASDYYKVWLIDSQTGLSDKQWDTGHWTLAMAISPDGTIVASAGDESARGGGGPMVRLWDTAQAAEIAELPTMLDSTTSVVFSRDSDLLVGQCCDRKRSSFTTIVWDVASHGIIASWPNAQRDVFDLNPRMLVTAADDEIVLFDLKQRRTVAKLRDTGGKVTAVRLSADGTRLASASEDRTVKVWSLEEQTPISTFQGFAGNVEQLLLTPDARYLLTADDGKAKVWDTAKGTLLYELPHGKCPMAFTPDNRTLITAPGQVHFWQVATGDELLVYPDYGYDSHCMALSPDGQTVAQAGGDRDESNGVMLWRAPRDAK